MADAVADVHDLAGWKDVVEAEHEVTAVAVPRADERPATGADPSADQRARVRRRVVRVDQAVSAEHLVELEHVDPGPDRARAVVEVDLVDLVHPLDVDEDPVVQRHGAVGQAGAAVSRHDRDS